MFHFSSVHTADDTGVQPRIRDRLRRVILGAIAASVALTATPAMASQQHEQSGPSETDKAAFYKDAQTALAVALDASPDNTIFDHASQDGQETDQDRAIQRNVVLILKTWTKDGNQMVSFGTGTIVANSPDEAGNNGILTAGHVIDGDLDGVGGHPTDPCARDGVICSAFSVTGEPLGRVNLRSRSQTDFHDGSFQSKIHNDAVMLSVQPINRDYAALPGVPIAQQLPGRVVEIPADTAMRDTGDGHVVHVGLSKGASGSAIIRDGEIIGVASYQVQLSITGSGMMAYDESAVKGAAALKDRRSFRLGANLGDAILARGDTDAQMRFPSSAIKLLNDVAPNQSQYGANRVMIAPIYGLTGTVRGGHSIEATDDVKAAPVSVYGLPFCIPVRVKTTIDPTKRFSSDMHGDILAVRKNMPAGPEGKQTYADRATSRLSM